jgi:hypothetical protein
MPPSSPENSVGSPCSGFVKLHYTAQDRRPHDERLQISNIAARTGIDRRDQHKSITNGPR